MANEFRAYHASGKNLYLCIFNTSGNVWYVTGEVFEAWGTSGRDADDYDIALTDKSGSLYLGSWDANLTTAGYYYVIYYRRAGVNPADGDYAIGHEEGYWDGTTWHTLIVALKTIDDNVDTVEANTGKVVYGSLSAGTKSAITNKGSVIGFVEKED